MFVNEISILYLWDENFTNHNFSKPIEMHATYFSMYLFLAMIVFIKKLITRTGRKGKYLYGAVLLFCVGSMLQLFSRAVCFALLITLIAIVPFYFAPLKRRLWYIVAAIVIIAIPVSIILKQDDLRDRYISEVRQDLSVKKGTSMVVEPRMARWKASLELFKERPLMGYGLGAEKKLLMTKYLEKGFLVSYVNKLNTHNQYINYMIVGGITGLLVLLSYLILGGFHSIKHKDFVFSSFVLLLVVVSFSENIFSTNKGIFFIAFFFPFLWLSGKKAKVD
jgi:O-antigen ligase